MRRDDRLFRGVLPTVCDLETARIRRTDRVGLLNYTRKARKEERKKERKKEVHRD